MKNVSISSFINIIFIFAFSAIILSFLFFIKLDQEKFESERKDRYNFISSSFLSGFELFPTKDYLQRLYSQFEVAPLTNRQERLAVINQGKLLSMSNSVLGRARIFKYDDEYYIYVQKLSYNIMLQDVKDRPYNRSIALILFILSITIFLILFILLRKKLSPLKKLDKQIQKFSNGDSSVKLEFNHDDEIGKIAKSFNDAISNINHLTSSKSLFMRNMMHELKTPITKAMFIAEAMPNDYNRQVLQRAFERMDSIIKELSTVEKITSSMNVLYQEVTRFDTIYENTLNILLINPNKITPQFKSFTLNVDLYLFSIVLKNLLDNAIKFSPNEHAQLIATERKIKVISQGNKLQHSLDYYTEPFSQEEKRSDGFGLGLYIVKTICELHGFCLRYHYENGENCFSIDLKHGC
jgi:two-component system OmpR family sensor kinase